MLDVKHMCEQSRPTLNSLQIRFPSMTAPLIAVASGAGTAIFDGRGATERVRRQKGRVREKRS
jgi:hypothetical protein